MKSIGLIILILGINFPQVFCRRIINGTRQRYERNILKVSPDKVMKLVKNGDEKLNIPIFDPFKYERFELDVHDDDLVIVGELRAMVFEGLSNIANIDNDYNFWKSTCTLTLNFPQLSVTGKYDFETIEIDDTVQMAFGKYSTVMNDLVVKVILKHKLMSVRVELFEIIEIGEIQIVAEGTHNNEQTSLTIFRSDNTREKALPFCKRFHITDVIIDLFSKTINTIFEKHSIMTISKVVS